MLKMPRVSIWLSLGSVIIILLLAGTAFAAEDLSAPPVETPGNISVDFKDADIQSVLRAIAAKGNVNIVWASDVTGAVTVKLSDVPWETALDVILKTHDLSLIHI